jgi:hypothetical protein
LVASVQLPADEQKQESPDAAEFGQEEKSAVVHSDRPRVLRVRDIGSDGLDEVSDATLPVWRAGGSPLATVRDPHRAQRALWIAPPTHLQHGRERLRLGSCLAVRPILETLRDGEQGFLCGSRQRVDPAL